MSKVIHLSDDAHNTAKGFCKQHGLKMSDWVAALIADAIATGRTDPMAQSARPPPPPPPPPLQQLPAPVAAVVVSQPREPIIAAPPPPPPASNQPPKKKLERFREEQPADGLPAWAAPPFWAKQQQTK